MSTKRSKEVPELTPEDEAWEQLVDQVCSRPISINYMAENCRSHISSDVKLLHYPDLGDLDPDGFVGGVPDVSQIRQTFYQRGLLEAPRY